MLLEGLGRRLRRSLPRAFRRTWPRHAIDVRYGIETSAPISARKILSGIAAIDDANVGYVGSQPSIIRKALATIAFDRGAVFLDLGCGKGRALVVATEYPFARIVGIEISDDLCRVARQNAAKIRDAFPERTAIEIVTGSATDIVFEDGVYVIYIYNSFGVPIIRQLLSRIEAALASHPRLKIFIIYYNPVCYETFDAAAFLVRHAADKYSVADDETGSSPFGNDHDSVIVYQSTGAPMQPRHPGADRAVHITIPKYGADVVTMPA